MLVTNQRLDKLAAARVDFRAHGMLKTPLFREADVPPAGRPTADDEDDDEGAVDEDILGEVILSQKPRKFLFHDSDMYFQTCSTVPRLPHNARQLGAYLRIPNIHELISHFLYDQDHPDNDIPLDDIPLDQCPVVKGKVRVFPSSISMYYTPSDKSGIRGMFRERIRAVDSWRNGPGRHDTVFMSGDPNKEWCLKVRLVNRKLTGD